MKRSVLAALAVGAALASAPAGAAIVTYNFTAELTDLTAIGVDVNSLTTKTISGSYSVDTTVPADGFSTSIQANFPAITAFSITYDGNTVTATPASSGIQQDDAFPGFHDRYGALGGGFLPAVTVGDFSLLGAGFVLRDLDDTVINDARNLLTDIDLADFEQRDFLGFFTDTSVSGFNLVVVSGLLTSLRQADVPAPAALLLLATALTMLGAARRQRG